MINLYCDEFGKIAAEFHKSYQVDKLREMIQKIYDGPLLDADAVLEEEGVPRQVCPRVPGERSTTGRIRIQGRGVASLISGQDYYEFGVNKMRQSGLVWSRL